MNINRRRFIEMTSVLAGTAFAVVNAPWVSAMHDPAPFGRGPNDRVRLGFIGVGNRGRTLLRNVKASIPHTNAEIVAVCDDYEPFYERAKTLTDNQVPAFRDWREMLDTVEMDGVIIATPPNDHAAPTIAAFEKGIHVFVEKNLARQLGDVKDMYDKHLETGKIMLVGFQRLYSPVYLTAMERIRTGRYGPITMVKGNWHRNRDWIEYPKYAPGTPMDKKMNWRLYRESSGGMITELCSHHLHISNWILDEQPVNVVGSGSIVYWKDHREVWDNFGLVFQYPNGQHFTYSCLQSNLHNGVQIQALGKKGMLDLEVNKEFFEQPPKPPAIRQLIHDIETRLFETVPIGGATWVPAEPVKYGGEFISNEWDMNETQLFLEAFVDFIRKGNAPEELTLSGYRASVWALMAEQATYSNERITLPQEYRI
jgi:predicted dehydrogenase